MLRLLIVFGTVEGQTRIIADYMAATAREAGHTVTELDAAAIPSHFLLTRYDAVLVGAPVHQGVHQDAVMDFARAFRSVLQEMPTAFFSVSLMAALPGEEHQDEARRYIWEFVKETGWEPGMTCSIAGALRFTRYDFFKRVAMRLFARVERLPGPSDEHEFTDWAGVRRFVTEFLEWAEERCVRMPTQPT